MRYLVPIILVVPALASAQPQPAARCDVTIVRAPADVRPVVQHWIDAEPRCRGSLEVRIIPTEGGFYLLARDERGHTNERVVPDAQSAGVLIASWAADDRADAPSPMGAPAPAVPLAAPTPAPMEAPTPAPMTAPMTAPMAAAPMAAPMATPMLTAPGATPVFERPLGVDAGAPRAPAAPRWLTVGALAGDGLGGARVEIDLKRGRWWSVGVAGSMTASQHSTQFSTDVGTLSMFDAKVVAYAAASLRSGAFELRGSFGLGFAYSKIDMGYTYATTSYGGDGGFGVGDLSILLGYQLGDNWGLAAGPVATIYNQDMNLDPMGAQVATPMEFRRFMDVSFFMALRHRL